VEFDMKEIHCGSVDVGGPSGGGYDDDGHAGARWGTERSS
jgi:hypothetical protein